MVVDDARFDKEASHFKGHPKIDFANAVVNSVRHYGDKVCVRDLGVHCSPPLKSIYEAQFQRATNYLQTPCVRHNAW